MTVLFCSNNYLASEWWQRRFLFELLLLSKKCLLGYRWNSFVHSMILFACSFKALHSMGIKSFEALAEADPRKIEIVTGRKYPFGNHIKESLSSLPPEVDLKLEEVECPRHGKTKLIVTLTRLPQSYRPIKRHYADMVCWLKYLFLFFTKNWPLQQRTLSRSLLAQKKITRFSFMRK